MASADIGACTQNRRQFWGWKGCLLVCVCVDSCQGTVWQQANSAEQIPKQLLDFDDMCAIQLKLIIWKPFSRLPLNHRQPLETRHLATIYSRYLKQTIFIYC